MIKYLFVQPCFPPMHRLLTHHDPVFNTMKRSNVLRHISVGVIFLHIVRSDDEKVNILSTGLCCVPFFQELIRKRPIDRLNVMICEIGIDFRKWF